MSTSESGSTPGQPRRRRLAPLIWLGSAVAAVVVALGVSGTLSGFTASIDNTTNTAATGALLMSETNGTATCYSNGTAAGAPDSNAGTCATINKFGGSTTMAPGVAGPAVTVTITNNGNIKANTFTLTPDGACTQASNAATTAHGSASDLCAKLNVTITKGTGTSGDVFSGTMAGLGSGAALTLLPVDGGSSATFTFQVTLDSSAGNSYQGLQASTGLTWAFAQ